MADARNKVNMQGKLILAEGTRLNLDPKMSKADKRYWLNKAIAGDLSVGDASHNREAEVLRRRLAAVKVMLI